MTQPRYRPSGCGAGPGGRDGGGELDVECVARRGGADGGWQCKDGAKAREEEDEEEEEMTMMVLLRG